jgi:23S rRNA (adenine-N6)-dimethyltransferase
MRNRIAYSQNFIKDKGLVANLINKTSLTDQDVVCEIGVGQGIITEQLLKRVKKVIAFEIDKNLYDKLSDRLTGQNSLELKFGNFLDYNLPSYPFKVFSNIPFNITSAIVKKLTQSPNTPIDTYLFVQKEAAKKLIGKTFDDKNSQLAVLLKPWFDTEVIHKFDRNDFFPKPMIDIVLMRIEKREKPLVEARNKELYEDFIVYTFNQFKPNVVEGLAKVIGKDNMFKLSSQLGFKPHSKPSELDYPHWQGIFTHFLTKTDMSRKAIIRGASNRLSAQQEKLEKIHRTRVDKNWKSKSNQV